MTMAVPRTKLAPLAALLLLLLPAGRALAETEVDGTTPGGAFYKIVVPDDWNGELVIWNHGYDFGDPAPLDDAGPLADLHLLQHYAVAASSLRMSQWALFKSNQDGAALLDEFTQRFGPPSRLYIYGASLGGLVTARMIEQGALRHADGAFLFCGAVAGSRQWDGGLDVRLVYDAVCGDVPGAAIPGGAKGLPKGSALSRTEVEERVNVCTGVDLAKGKRSKKQKQRLKKLLKVAQIPESFVQTVMRFATQGLSDLTYSKAKLRGKQGVGNEFVDYGDARVNADVERVAPQKKGARKLARNYTPKGTVGDTKIVSLHTDKDGLVLVENESEYAKVVPPENLTVAVAVEKIPSHCGFSIPEIVAGWEAIRKWVEDGPQPTAESLQADCQEVVTLFGGVCRIDPDFVIPDLDGRIRPR